MRARLTISKSHLLAIVTALFALLQIQFASHKGEYASIHRNINFISIAGGQEEITTIQPIDFNTIDPAETHELITHSTCHEAQHHKIVREKFNSILSGVYTSELLGAWFRRINHQYKLPCSWSPSIPVAQRKLII